MAIKHHPDDATLLSYAAGSLSECLSAVVAAHMALCPRCADHVQCMESLGGVFFEGLTPAPLTKRLAGLGSQGHPQAARSCPTDHVAAHSVWPALTGRGLDTLPWKRLGLGLWHVPLPLSSGSTGDLRFFKVAPGQIMPEHGHGGMELTLVLRGSYCDALGHFGPGDVADLDSTVEHQPVTDAVAGCICLVGSEERANFKGIIARLVQPFTGL